MASEIKKPLRLGYWRIRGLAQPIRLLLKYNELEFDNVMYEQGDAPDYSREDWYKVKYSLGLDFPNLPYLIDGDFKLTQSSAILRHIARKFDMCGSTAEEMAIVDMLENQAVDFRTSWARLIYNPDFETLKDGYIKTVKEKFEQFSTYLGQKKWFTGDKLTYVEFIFYEVFSLHRDFEPALFDEFENLTKFLTQFEALPTLKEYIKSPEFLALPVTMKHGSWRN